MAIDLTPDEQQIVAEQAVDEADLPTYYNAALKKDVPISRDFETFLILSTTELKTSAIQWINQVVGLTQANTTRDKLRTLVITQQLANAQAKLDAYNVTIGDFSDFRENFQTDTRFDAVAEVVLFISDLQLVMDEQILGQQKGFFDQTLGLMFQSSQSVVGLTQDDIEELQSWIPVLSAYLTDSTG